MTNNDDDLGGSAPDFSSFGSPIDTSSSASNPDAAPSPAPRRSAFAWAPDVDDALETASKEFGVDRGLLDTFARIESSGRADARTGSYKGLFQLSDDEFFKHGGQSNPFDPYENARAGAAKLRAEKADFSKRYGRDPNAAELYMIHQQGVGGSAAHWANPDAPAWQNMYSTAEGRQKGANWARRAIWGNVPDDMKRQFGSVDNITSRQFTKLWEDKVARFGGGAAPASAGTTAVAAAATGRPSGMMGLGGAVSDDDDEETEEQFPLPGTDEDDELPSSSEFGDDDGPMYLGGPEPKPDFSRFGKPLGQAATPQGTSKPDFSKFGKPVRDTNDPAADQKPMSNDGYGDGFWENVRNPQQYKELAKGVIPGAISMQGTALQAPDAFASKAQHSAHAFGAKQLEVMDRIDRGEAVPETEDAFGYQHMGQEDRAKARKDTLEAQAAFNPTPLQERALYKAGEAVQEYAKNLMPAAPGYEKSVGRQLGEGLGSMAGGMPYGLFGRAPAGLFFGAAGAGEATQRAVEFDKKDREAGGQGLTQEQIALAGIAGVAPGATDLLPLETLLGRLPLPVPPGARGPLAQAIGRIGGQAFVEGLQEGGQQFLQNLIAREVYNPKQDLGEEVLGNTGIGAGVGAIAQGGKEVGSGLVKLAGGRRGRHAGNAPEAGEDEGQKALPPPPKQITGPHGEQPAQENMPPPASAEEAGWLRAQGWDDKDIAEMSPEQRAAEIEEAKAQGLKPVAGAAPAPKNAPDNPSAEPVTDLLAQAADLNDPKSERSGVYVPAASLDALDEKGAEQLAQSLGDSLVLQNFDDKGGHLVVADYETAKAALEAKAKGEDLQKIIGEAVGAGSGKPADGSVVVQQRTKDGAVVRESLVTPDKVDATRKAFARDGHEVEVLSPQEALQRREEMIAAQRAPKQEQGTRSAPVRAETPEAVATAGQRVAEPTPAQAEAGNYRKGHVDFQGLPITIETPKGGTRRGVKDGKVQWEVPDMPAHYGYVKGTEGRDGDHVDVYIGDNPQSDRVYVIDQVDAQTGKFDEHKAVLGVDSLQDAGNLYSRAFSDGAGPDRIGNITEMSVEEFKQWLAEGKRTKPAAKEEPKAAPRRWDGPELSEEDIHLLVANWKFVRDVNAMPKPESLAQFVISQGGLRDDAREVRHIMGSAKERPGLVNKDGVTLDDMALKAWESGFFEDSERPTIADFLNKLQDDLHTGAEVRLIDQDALDSIKIAGEIAEELNDYGITASRFRSEASLREYFGQARPKAARAAEDAEGQEAAGREGADAASDIIDEVPFGPEREGQQGAVARDEARDDERAGAVRDREDQDQQGAEPAEGARDSGEDRGPAGTGQAGRGSDVTGARETGPSDSGRRELPPYTPSKHPRPSSATAMSDVSIVPVGDGQYSIRDKHYVGRGDNQKRIADVTHPERYDSHEDAVRALEEKRGAKPDKEEPAVVVTEKSGQTSLVPEPTTKEKIAAEAKAKERKGGNEPMDVGMFGSEKDQTDLVDMAKEEPKPAKKADPFKGEMPDEPDFDFIANQGWRDHLMRARVYATALRIDHRGKSLEEIVKAIDEATTAHAGVPEGVKVWMSDSTLDAEDARMKGGEYHAYASREKPYSVVDGYGDTPEAAMRNAVANLKPAKSSRLGQGLGDLMGKSGGQAKAVETVAAGAKAPTETAAPVEVSEDVAAALERGKEKARAYVLRLGRQNSAEFGMMVLKDGSTKENKVSGTENFLRVDMETAPDMWTGEPKTVDFHHNHPKSTSFSRADYTEAAVRPALRRTWVHGHDGSEYWAEFKADAETLGKAYDIARAATETVDKKGMQMFRYRGHIIAQMMKQGGVIDYFADITPADAEERIEAIRAAIGEEKIADAIEDIANLKEGANGLLDRGTGSAGRQSQDVGTAPDQAAESAAEPARGADSDSVRPAEDQAEAARGVDQAAELTPEQALQQRLIDSGFKTIVEARKFAAGLGITGTNKQVDEAIEKAVVGAARSIAVETANAREAFDALLALYENQPNLASRTGTSVANQAYSTPVPLAYVASKLAGVATADVVFEPTAGNGALLMEAGHGNNDRVIANELDPSRAEALKAQGFQVSSEDASAPELVEPKSADAVIMNPPFGAVKEGGKSKVFTVDGWQTTTIDHAIALNALKGMTDDGKAVLILGGTKAESTDERRKDYRGKAKREFYARLYKDYNVTDHFTVSGDLYTKQGASWPVDVIVIEGRGQSERKLPAAQPPEILKTWDQVAEKLPNATSAGRNELAARPVDRQAGKPAEAGAEPAGRDGSDRKAPVGRGSERVQPEGEGKPAAVRAERAQGKPADVGSRGRDDAAKPASDRDGGRTDQPAAAQPVRSRVKREAPKGGQAFYEPTSTAASLDTLIPVNMASAARDAMAKVEERRGSVDELVADRLGYDPKELSQYFSAEQVDALAAAIDNVERGAAFIIGDQTGIGKGRIAAGMLRYAMKKGMVPVFLTEKPDLYGDIFRDLRDIGVPEMLGREPRMFITNAGETITLDEEALAWKQESEEARRNGEPAPKRRGKFLIGGTAAKVQENMKKIANGEDIADVVFTTYDQLNTVKGATTPRRTFLSQIAPRAMIVMDEAHNAGGQAKTGWEKKDAPMNRADFARELAAKARGVMFSSATYAKRPDVMDLYARTDMGKAVDDPKELGELIQRGGVPMQQIVASMLAKSGQYLRRERSFDGVDYQLTPVPVDLKAYKQFSASMQAIFRFDLAVEEFRDEWGQDKLDELGWKKSKDDGVGGGSASSVAFGSLMHNITNQMLLAIKAEQTAQQAIKAHKAGEKPVIALANTNESFIKDFAEGEGIKIGQPLDLDFSAVLERYLERTLRITVKGPDNEKQHIQIPIDELPLSLRQEFRAAMNAIKEGDYASLPISPIDWIRFRLGEAGMSVKEVTGRQTMIDYSKPTPTYVQRPKSEQGASGKRGSIAYFNSGKLDALVLNRSGSTGVSMHASEKFKDQRKRRMIIAQPEGNIDTHCLDAQTEILTPEGFKGINDVFDTVAAFDPATGVVTWQPVTGRVERQLGANESMFGIQSPGLDVRVTDQHRMLMKHRRQSVGWRLELAGDLGTNRKGNWRMPVSGVQLPAQSCPLTDHELHFIGWVLTDGTINYQSRQIVIWQAEHQPHHDHIKACLAGCGFKYGVTENRGETQYNRTSRSIGYVISLGQWRHLQEYLDKDFPVAFENLDRRQLAVLLEALHLGDGTKFSGQPWTRRSYHIATGRKTFADRLQSLCIRRGFRANVSEQHYNQNPLYMVRIKDKVEQCVGGKNHNDGRPTFGPVPFDAGETVWCVENSVGTLITRRNGKVAFLGNCQMLGRVHRTGQVVPPAFTQIAAEIPAEARPTAVLMKKMASLNANTTGARSSAFTVDSVDFINEVGDKVVAEVLLEDPDLNAQLGWPLKIEDGKVNSEEIARKATGRLVLLDPEVQSRFLDQVQKAYMAEIEQLDALGENPLEAKTVDLQAKTLETTELKPKTGDSPFLDAVRIEKVSAKAQGRAMAPSEVADNIADAIKVSKPSGSDAQVLASLEAQGRAWGTKETERVSALIRKQMAAEIAETGADSKESTRRRLEAQFQRWNETMGLVYPGARVRLGMQAGDLDAVVMSVERTGKAKQMGALSAWTVKMAVPDSMRQLEFPMSKLFPPGTPKSEDEKGASLNRAGASHNDLVDAFELARKEGRETRYIMTGNILGGFEQASGRIVNYTDDKGEVRPGILLGRSFRIDSFMDERAVRFQNAGQIVEFMDKAPLTSVKAWEGDIELSQYRDTYRIEMASARAKAGQFFTDAALRKAIGQREFEKRGNKMIATGLSKAEFAKAVAEMQKIGAKFEVRDQQDLAQSIVSKRTGEQEEAQTEYRTNKDGFELRLPFKEKWGDPRYNPADREHALGRLREIQTMPVRDVPWDDLIQARNDINEITANLFFYRPDMTDAEVRNYDEVYFYIRDPKGTSKGDPVPSFFRDKMTDERSADLRDFQVQGKQALDHMLASRRSGLRGMLFYGPDSGLWTAPKERKAMDPSKVGEKMRSGFYFSAGRKLAEAPDFLFKMNGQAVINWLLKKGVSRDEITHFGLQEKFGQQANDPTPRKFTREEFQKQIADRMFDFRRKVSWLNPERSKNDYELGGTRAFRGPRIPGRGIYFERLMAFPKKLKGGEAFPPGDFISPHWEDEMKNAWASWRGSVREVPGYGKMVVGEEGQTDFMQGANSGRRPRVSGEDYAKLKRDHVRYNKVMDEAYVLVSQIAQMDLVRDAFGNDRDMINAWKSDLAPSLRGAEYTRDVWQGAIDNLRDAMRVLTKKEPNNFVYLSSPAWKMLEQLEKIRSDNEQFFEPGAKAKYRAEAERSFTPETPLDQRYVRTMLRDLLLHAASEKADSIAISTSETNDRIQINTYQSAAHFYDGQLAPRLERELRVLTGDYSLTLEKVALPKAQGHPRNEKAYTVWAAKLPAEVWEKIRTEGLPVLAVGSDLEEAGVPKRTDYKSAIPDIRRAMGSILKSGRPVSINGEVVTAIHKAVDEVRGMVPAGAKVYALARVEPTEDPGTVIAVFEDEDGNEYPLTESWNYLSGIRAAYFEGNLFFVRLSPRALRDVGQFNGGIAAELGHEVAHALRWSGRLGGDTWARLLDHAKSLRLLDGEFGTYLKIVGDPSADKVADVTTREIYERLYNTRENRAELMDQEEVAHLVEWYIRGELSRQQVEPVIDILDDIVAGRVQPADREEALEREMAFAAAEQGRSQRRELDRLGFYSKALEAAKDLRQAKGTPEQMRAMLRTAGVKEAEIAATGLDGFLAGKASATKDEIVQFLRENRVEASEATYQTGADPGNYGQVPFYAEGAAGGPKWASYSIDPSNPTYRETVIHLPEMTKGIEQRIAEIEAEQERMLSAGVETYGEPASEAFRRVQASKEYNDLQQERYRLKDEAKSRNFTSGHWSEPNVIAHARTSLQKTADGKTVFLVDELQSDWGQKLRDGGVRDDAKIAELKARHKKLDDELESASSLGAYLAQGAGLPHPKRTDNPWHIVRALENATEPKLVEHRHYMERLLSERNLVAAETKTAEAATPGHPLVNTTDQWTTTAFRRLIRQAVEAGADYIALTPGQVQTERFALSRKIGALRYDPEMKELQYKEVISRTGQVADYYSKFDNDGKPVEAKDLPGIIGKEAAERLLAQPRQYVSAQYSVAGPHTLTELGEIGGSGMKATYDSIYPRTLGKLLGKMDPAAGKMADMPLKSSLDGREFFDAPTSGKPNVANIEEMFVQFHTFPLTDKVKESVMEDGQPMFAIGGIKAKGAPLSSRNLAESMERKGKDAEFILKNTGWFRGADQKWRFEIDDSAAKIINLDQKVTTPKAGFWRSFTGKRAPGVPEWAGKGVQIGLNIKIPEILSHEKLFNAYPMLRNMRVSIITGAGVPKTHEGGAFIWKEEGGKILYSPIQIKARNKADILPYLMHEIQHYIQRKEGFQGGSASSGRRGEFDTVRLDYNAAPSKQMIFGNEQFSTTTFRSQKDAIGYNERPDWRSHIAGMNAAEQTALAIADLWDALERAPSMRGLISINPETRAFLANKFIEYRDLDRKKADKIDEEAIRDHILPALQAELMSQLRVTAEDYLGSLGEAEANAVMERLNYTPEQRRTMLPKMPKGANSGQVTPDFREAAQAVLDSARKTQAIREKWLMDPVDLGDGVSVQRWRENSLSFSRDEAFDRGAEVAAELDFENGRAIVHFLKHALDGYKVGTKGGYAPLTDAEMTLLADKAEAYVRSINLLPTPDIRLKTDRMDIPQERLSDREIAFWKNRDPFFFAADVSKAVPRNIMAWAWSLDEGELGRMIAPDLVAHIVEARDVVRAEAEEAAQRILDATQEALHGEDSVSAAHQNLIEDARMAELLRAADLNKVEDFRGLLHLYHQRALSKEAAEKTAAGPIEMPMPVDYVTAKLDPEQWRIRDRDAHKEPEAVPVGVWNGHKLSTGTKAQAIVYQDSASNGGVWRGGISGVHLPTMAGTLQTSPPLASMNEAKVWVEKTLQANAIVFDKATGAMASLVRRARLTKNKQSAVSTDLTEAINIVNRIAGREVEVRFSETIAPLSGSTESPLGTYQRPRLRADAIITLATSNEDLLTTAGHEAWHHVEEVLANDAERKLLSSPAEMRRMRAQVADEIGMDITDPRLAQIPDTEIRAIAFQKYRREKEEGRQPQGIHIGIRRFWDRMVKILAVVRNALNGHGLKSYEDVFEAARAGEIAQRPAETPSPEARNNAIVRQDEAIAAEPQDVNDVMASLIPRVIKQSVARTMRRFEVSERVDRLRVGIQDKFLPVRRIQEEKERQTGTKIPINLDTYVAEALFHGRAGEQTADLKTDYIEPLVEILRKAEITKEQFDSYLYARHAQERNAEIAKINPGLTSGSGMTDAEANAILAAARGKQAAYDQAAKLVDTMIEETRTRLLRSGLISRETFDAWATKFANYVPLRGFEAGQDEPDRPRSGRGFDIRGPEAMQALGRRSKADSPLAYALMQAQQAIIRSEKNRVDKTLYRFIQAYPDPSLYQIYRGEYRRRLNPVTKQVESYWVPPQFVRDDAIHGVKIGGKQYYMELKDPGLARAMRGVQGEQHNAVLRGMMWLSRTYASLLTSYNPEFVISNFLRDIQTALLNVTDVADKPKATRMQILKEATSLKSMRGVMAALYGHEGRTIFGTKRDADETMLGTKRSAGAQDYARWFEEYRLAGGKISFMEFNDVERIQRDVTKSIERGRFSRVTRKAFGLVNDLNTAVENGVRLSTYIAMRKAGIGQDRAAFVARELTVNFNRKGEWSPVINSMYLFFNASVQGTTRMAQAIAKSRTLQVGVASIMGAAFMFDWWNYMIAGDDDDGKNRWDKLESWKKERNLIIMTGRADGSYIQIPMPYGYNLFWYGAQQTGAVMRGAVKPHEAAIHVATSMLDVLSPIGGASGSVAQMVAPTLADPFVQVIENKTWYGGPIFPTKYNKNLPDSENAFSSVNPWFQAMARTLNSATGGNTARKGAIDVSPEVIEHFFEFAGGGVAKFINNVYSAGSRAANGEEWLPEKTPFVRRVYGKATTESRRRDFYQAWEEVDAAKFEIDNLIKNTRKGTARQDEIEAAREKNAVELQAYGFMRDTQRALSATRKERTTIELSDRPRAEKEAKLKEIQERENQIILRSLGQYNRLKKQSKQPPRAEAAE